MVELRGICNFFVVFGDGGGAGGGGGDAGSGVVVGGDLAQG